MHPKETAKAVRTTSGSPRITESQALWRRRIAITTAVVFVISSAFPVTAGLAKDTTSFPKLWGMLDVSIAFVLTILAFVVIGLAGHSVTKQAEEAAYRAYRVLTHGLLTICAAFFLFGDRIVWINCLTGFAWRAWLLLYALPAWFTVLGATADLGSLRK